MSNFFGVLLTGVKGLLGIATSPGAVGLVTAVNPAFGAIYSRIVNAVVTVEAKYAAAGIEKAGPAKSIDVLADFNSGLAMTQEILATQGKQLTYDGASLDTAIKTQADALSAIGKLHSSFKIVDLA